MKVKKVGGQISGGGSSLGRLSQKGTTGRAGTGASKSALGYSKMLGRNLSKMSANVSRNLARGAHD